MKTYVLYHKNCYDGFGAAWAAWKRLGDTAEYIPVNYGADPPPLEIGALVYILDFSYPRKDLLVLAEEMYHITVLDHHKTAREELEGLGMPAHPFDVEHPLPGLFVMFDMEESGATLAWQYFSNGITLPIHHLYKPPDIPGQRWIPEIIKYVKDRDLWLFKQPSSKEIHAWLRAQPFDFEGWNWLNHCLTDDEQFRACVANGKAILLSHEQQIKEMATRVTWVELGGYTVPCVNATILFSEVGDYLCQQFPETPFAAYYFDRDDGKRQWGLRARKGFDCSAIAKQYGGGGHPGAAGFETERPDLL